ncbi:MAG: hypothetical protein QXQ14_00445 [Candidatus Aenigmatarchaeota archaeon]
MNNKGKLVLLLLMLSLSISFAAEFNLNLNSGWNLISIPLKITNVETECNVVSIYTYENGKWVKVNNLKELEVNKGYWVYVKNSCKITFIGEEVAFAIPKINKGWNLIGGKELTCEEIKQTCNPIIRRDGTCFYTFVPGAGWIAVSRTIKSNGYWVYCRNG